MGHLECQCHPWTGQRRTCPQERRQAMCSWYDYRSLWGANSPDLYQQRCCQNQDHARQKGKLAAILDTTETVVAGLPIRKTQMKGMLLFGLGVGQKLTQSRGSPQELKEMGTNSKGKSLSEFGSPA